MAAIKKKKADPACCTAPADRIGPVAPGQAAELVSLFKALANPTRLQLLHALVRAGELCVGSLADNLGMSPQAISNQLQRLADQGIVSSRRQGTTIYYRVCNSCVTELLDRGLCLVGDGCAVE